MLTTPRGLVLGLLAATLCAPSTARADEPYATAAGGYSFVRELGTAGSANVDYTSGWFASATRQILFARLSAVGEVTGSQRANIVGETTRLLAVLGGARVEVLRLGPLRLTGGVLAGVERFSEPGFVENGLALEPGAGIDVWLLGRLGIRISGGYRLVRAEQTTFKEARLSAGGAIRLGKD